MVPKSEKFTPDQIKEFNDSLEYMKNLINVYTWESCNTIRAYLSIFGKLKASEISKRVGLEGEKSVYKSLNRLIDAGLVAKEYEEGTKRNAYYYSTRTRVNDPDFSKKFIDYLLQQNQYHLISDYLKAANHASMGFLQVMTNIMEDQIIAKNNQLIGEEFINNTVFIETIFSLPDPKPFLKKMKDLIKSEVEPQLRVQNDPKKPMPNASALFLAFVPLTSLDYEL